MGNYIYCMYIVEILQRIGHWSSFPNSVFSDITLELEISRGGSIYTMENSKYYKSGFLIFPQRAGC